jgi:methyl-accepting chemotaxis protein
VQIFNSIRNKIMLANVLVILPPLLVLGWYGGTSLESSLRAQGLQRLETRISVLSAQIEGYLAGTDGDVLLLAGSPSLSQYLLALDSGDRALIDAARKNVSQSLVRLSEIRGSYYRMRYLDDSGRELIRITNEGGRSTIATPGRLDNQGGRKLFDRSMKLPKGEVLVAGPDLARGNEGEVENPHRPIVRYATPVFDATSRRRGVLLIDVAAGPLLDRVASIDADVGETLFFVADDGSYLAHPDPDKTWGGADDLATGVNLLQDDPTLGETLLAADALTRTESGEYVTLATPVAIPGIKGARLGVLIDQMPNDVLFATASRFRNNFNVMTFAALAIALAIGVLISGVLTRPIVELTAAVDKMSRGELDEPIAVSSNDEMQTLASAMERLRKSMKMMLDRLG